MATDEISLCTEAELRAQLAEGLPSIGAFNLLSIKRTVAQFLSGIGGSVIFDEYTKHDISHINEMLRLLDWIVPASSQPLLTPADWLHIVLGVYFHDLGMYVTEREFEARNQSDFDSFKDTVLFSGPMSSDYRAKISTLGADRAERFFYQEFVRATHAKRIRAWLTGIPAPHLGVTHVAAEVSELVKPLGEQFRDDLGIICESHHLDDLDNFKKYSIAKAYGRRDDEVSNLQYSAILLRTADILHMTKDRTPSVMFRTINPSDPISQREWRKQMGVNRVCSKLGKNVDGTTDASAPRDTVEVHAFFTEAEPFFALSSFLNYVQQQLQQCHQWAEKALAAGAKVSFPWKWIDRENIEAKGFLSKVFAFELDQPRILNLLTGHTLYDDSGVVLRELIQNSIDAVRLQRQEDAAHGLDDSTAAGILVEWHDADRTLIVQDVGTGMTQEIVENHLLRVGSSRYSTDKFREEHPGFFPISRFGIGILTAFMISDEVDIYTCSRDENEARHIILRNLHGKYLIKLLPKTDRSLRDITLHGTRIQLKLRPSAKLGDLEATLGTWIVVPDCKVVFRSLPKADVPVGYGSIKQALETTLARAEIPVSYDEPPRQGDVRVFHTKRSFADVAFAMRWSETFKEWDFLTNIDPRSARRGNWMMGTCIEGIRVDFRSAGYAQSALCIMANASGAGAPRTNVARSGLERTPETKELQRLIYESLFERLETEIGHVRALRHLSETGALSEGQYMLAPLMEGPVDNDTFRDCVKDLPLLLVEKGGSRKSTTPRALESEAVLWTIDCPLYRSAEQLLREAESDASLSEIIELLAKSRFPAEPILCRGGLSDEWALGNRGVDELVIDRLARRVDIRWRIGAKGRYWKSIQQDALSRAIDLRELRAFEGAQEFLRDRFVQQLLVPAASGATVIGATDEICVRGSGSLIFLPGTRLGKFVEDAVSAIEAGKDEQSVIASIAVLMLIRRGIGRRYLRFDTPGVTRLLQQSRFELDAQVDAAALTDALNDLNLPNRVFDPGAGDRSKPGGELEMQL